MSKKGYTRSRRGEFFALREYTAFVDEQSISSNQVASRHEARYLQA
jgi:hypothetical protein